MANRPEKTILCSTFSLTAERANKRLLRGIVANDNPQELTPPESRRVKEFAAYAASLPFKERKRIFGSLATHAIISKKKARHDELTGLFNIGYFTMRLEKALMAVRRGALSDPRADRSFVLLYCDVIGLKTVNDNVGHKYGTEMIVSFARFLETHTRPEDVLARLTTREGGADEFGVLAPANVATMLEERFRLEMLKLYIRCERLQQPIPLRAAIGVVKVNAGNVHKFKDADAILELGDERMRAEPRPVKRGAPLKKLLAAYPMAIPTGPAAER
jgi:diguanylate cyclase (GGDEF)-like protein